MKPTDYLHIDTRKIYLEHLDLEKISSIISEGLTPLENEEAHEMVLLAAETWLARDLQEFEKSISIECPPEVNPFNNVMTVPAVLDLIATLRGTMQPFARFPGGKCIIDWKTTQAPVDTDSWADQKIRSWQWKIYGSLVPEAKIFIYRGVSRDKATLRKRGETKEFACRTREVMLGLADNLALEVNLQITGVLKMRDALLDSLVIFPRNTESCYDYGTACPYLTDCLQNEMPAKLLDRSKLGMLSFSKMTTFLQCPEKWRRLQLDREEGTQGESEANLRIGQAFHKGIAELYRQAFEKFN